MKNKIVYRGKVTVKTRGKPSIRKHNNGTNVLFSLLSNLVSGILPNDLTNKLPTKIGIIHDNAKVISSDSFENVDYNDFESYSILLDELLITSRSVNSTTNSVIFSTLLPNSSLYKDETRDYAEASENLFILLLNRSDEILAHAEINYEDLQEVWDNPIGQAKVEWEMFFANKEENDE